MNLPHSLHIMAPSLDCIDHLFCSEVAIEGSWAEEEEEEQPPIIALVDPVDPDVSISMLVEKENLHMPHPDYLHRLQCKALDPRARHKAITWLLKMQAHYNFGALTTALSINYLDRYLSSHEMKDQKDWMLQLLSVACLSLAAKIEEVEVPLLLDLQVEGAEYIFEPRTIQRMELLVMSNLGWRLSSVTPFSYVDFFIQKLGVNPKMHHLILSRTSHLVLNALEEFRFVEYRPSCIAMAATLCAVEELMPLHVEECKQTLYNSPTPKETCERCLICMNELFAEACEMRHKRKANCTTFIPQSPIGVLEASFSESTTREDTTPSVTFTPVLKKKRVESL